MKKLITLEYRETDDMIELNINKEGANYLKEILTIFIEENKQEHRHLFSPRWGGHELSPEQQSLDKDVKLIDHLKINYWEE